MSNLYGEEYAKVVWRAEDVKSINGAWSLEKCEEWLQDNERHISDRLIELGWDVVDTLLKKEDNDFYHVQAEHESNLMDNELESWVRTL